MTELPARYVRKGTGVVLLAYDLDKGFRHAQVREHRAKADYAAFIHHLQRLIMLIKSILT